VGQKVKHNHVVTQGGKKEEERKNGMTHVDQGSRGRDEGGEDVEGKKKEEKLGLYLFGLYLFL